ncbi:MAG: hypothetical protein Q8761_03235, partial [Sweet potato little leaf phytoplasma]|nr:hypothetical protein [Sweet potato little leaf phytoplasma]
MGLQLHQARIWASIALILTLFLPKSPTLLLRTNVLREGHRLYHMFMETINENNEHPKMITKEALE